VLFCLVCFGLVFSRLVRKQQNYFWDTISRIGGWGTNTKIIKTETLLHLNLEIFFLFHFIYLFFLVFIFCFFIFQSSLCLSNACSAYCWSVHYLSLLISLKLLFVCFVFFLLVCLFVFHFSFSLFAFHFLSPFHSRYRHCYYCKLENT
jgi:hypothetical protein